MEALWTALGKDRFRSIQINRYMTDMELDPWTSDSALYAAAAIAGAVWDPNSSDEKRKVYWEWWLSEAIETAYQHCKMVGSSG